MELRRKFTLLAAYIVLSSFESSLLIHGHSDEEWFQKDIDPVDPNFFYPNRFYHRTILITGGARGVGKATALRAAKEGANVVIADSLPEGADTAKEILLHGGKAIFVLTNVSSSSDCYRMVQKTVETFKTLDLVVNSASVMDGYETDITSRHVPTNELFPNLIHKASDDYWNRVFEVNIGGLFKSMRAELTQMVQQKTAGAIVNVASVGAMTGLPMNPAYVASEHAVSGLTRNAAIDYAPYGIRINSVNMAVADMWSKSNHVTPGDAVPKTSGSGEPRLRKMSLLQTVNSKHRPATVWEQVESTLQMEDIPHFDWVVDRLCLMPVV